MFQAGEISLTRCYLKEQKGVASWHFLQILGSLLPGYGLWVFHLALGDNGGTNEVKFRKADLD